MKCDPRHETDLAVEMKENDDGGIILSKYRNRQTLKIKSACTEGKKFVVIYLNLHVFNF